METIKRPGKDFTSVAFELLISVTKVHMNHLSTMSYAAHKTMNEFYDEVKELADALIEQYQGLTEQLITFPTTVELPIMKTPEDCINYLRNLYQKVDVLQKACPYDEIRDDLSGIKKLINSTKYKLIFLK